MNNHSRDIGEEILKGLSQAICYLEGEEPSSDAIRVHVAAPSPDRALEEDPKNE